MIQNTSSIYNFNNNGSILNVSIESIFLKIKFELESLKESIQKQYSDIKKFNRHLKFNSLKCDLFNNMDKLVSALKNSEDFLSDEMYIFIEVRNNIKYLFNKRGVEISLEDIDFISNYLTIIFDLIEYKLKLLKRYNFIVGDDFLKEYEIRYYAFNREYSKIILYFFENIYTLEDVEDMDGMIDFIRMVGSS